MKTENKDKLLSLLDNHKAKEEKFANLRKENNDKREQFLQSFEQLAKTTIMPLMEKYAEQIRPYGHYVSIRYSPTQRAEHGHGSTAATAKMEIYLNSNSAKSGEYPYVSFSASEHSQKVGISMSTIRPGSGGSTDNSNRDLELKQFTPEFIEQHIMDGISAIFNNKY